MSSGAGLPRADGHPVNAVGEVAAALSPEGRMVTTLKMTRLLHTPVEVEIILAAAGSESVMMLSVG